MLPTGHAAAGFLIAHTLLSLTTPPLSQTETANLLLLGAFAGFAPDLDMFWAFAKARRFSFGTTDVNHRNSLLHTPLFWILLGIVYIGIVPTKFGILSSTVVTVGALSHFFLDSFKMGIRWLWPVSNKYFAFHNAGEHHHYQSKDQTFFTFWLAFLKSYTTHVSFRTTFYLELIILGVTILILLTNY